MPILKFNAIEVERACSISKALIDELQTLLQCPREYFSLEVIRNDYIADGKIVSGAPVVEVYWFDRGQELQDQVAKIITKTVNAAGYSQVDVIFTVIQEKQYYENGEHF